MSRRYVGMAILLLVAGELEVTLGSAHGSALVSGIAIGSMALALAAARQRAAAVLAFVAAVLLLQELANGFLVGETVTTIIVLAVALYSAGRHASGPWAVLGTAVAGVMLVATRVAFDPAAGHPREAIVTALAVAAPVLVGRWSRGQAQLQREFVDRARRWARDRDAHARQAADEERARIAADLEVAVAQALRAILVDAESIHDELRSGRAADGGARVARIAATARGALADVRRALGVLRHDEHERRLDPARDLGHLRRPRPAEPTSAEGAPRSVAAETTGPRRSDAVVAAVVVAGAAVELAVIAPGGQRLAAPLTALLVGAPLLWRRRRPLAAAFAVLAGIAVQSALFDFEQFPASDIAAVVCATYTMGAHTTGTVGVGMFALADLAHAAAFYPDGVIAALLGGVALPWTIGRIVRVNRALTRASRQTQLDVERSREREARAAVMRERMSVARELHDAVAHNVSVIAIQAAGAAPLVERDPERARDCLALIVAVTREALVELERLAGEPGPHAPGLKAVESLAARARAAGLTVTIQVDTPELPPGLDLAAYRIVQEALANTTKHSGADRAWVTVSCTSRAVELEVTDDGRGPRGQRPRERGGGHGLVGMRERVALYHGSLSTGPRPGGGYRVYARIPVDA